ncbi:hypothetical protein EA772_20670 [Pedobacter sp. G11]|uniref:hypothetical protein n=1 Tax=Pedobacter sp. G11 TaxID=2482728 RepID=UPI000F5E8A79|nr:hypothetical protein [Pedobacter sp. G11]AZI27639.1 hypothetical protein EA772_20670 [Pedobacter sp. G11]
MKSKIIIVLFLVLTNLTFAQTYDGLQKLSNISQNVYFSENAKERAVKISTDVAKAETYFQKQFNVKPSYTLLVLSPTDWKKYAHPQAIYGIPHYLPDGRLVVASENNDFWKRNAAPVDKLPQELAEKMKATYTDKNGEINLTNAFDLLAIHELGHAFQSAAKMLGQRNWLNELLCNILLHTYLADNDPKQLPYITVFTKTAVSSFPTQRLKFTKLEDFEANYNEIAKNFPDNYGWYQCRFHVMAGDIYDAGGASSMKKIWSMLLSQKQKLNDDELLKLLNTDAALQKAIANWNQ